MLPLSLTFDHRVLDGAPAAAFYAQLNIFRRTYNNSFIKRR